MAYSAKIMENLEISSNPPLLVLFDDYRRRLKILLQNDYTEEFLTFVKHQEQCRLKWKESIAECKRLKNELDSANNKISQFEQKLHCAQRLLDQERKQKQRTQAQCEQLRDQVEQINDILSNVQKADDRLATEAKVKLDNFLSRTQAKIKPSGDYVDDRFHSIDEINSTGSMLSDISYTRSEDNIDLSDSFSERGAFKAPKRSSSPVDIEVPAKRRKSSRLQNKRDKIQKTTTNQLVATTVVTVPKDGPMTASSTIKTYPEVFKNPITPSAPPKTSSETDSDASEALTPFTYPSTPNLQSSSKLFRLKHHFTNKTILKPSEECGVCLKKLSFGSKISYCPSCRAIKCNACNTNEDLLHCIPVVDTPRRRNAPATISDYSSKNSAMIPPLIVHCIRDVELRGLDQVGIYRLSASEREVRSLKERFLRGKGICSLSGNDIHAVCGTFKDFLKNLNEPLVTFKLWPEFIRASQQNDPSFRSQSFHQAVSQLPRSNRNTLAYIIQHLQKVARSPDCKMTKTNLAKVLGPTIIGYSSSDPGREKMFTETELQARVLECLLEISSEYWRNIVYEEELEVQKRPTEKYMLRGR